MSIGRHATAALLTLMCAHAGASVAAQEQAQDDAPGEYRRLIAEGLREYDVENFVEARVWFLRAHALYPNARTLRVLGMAEFELRRYPESIDYLKQSLASQIKPLTDELRSQVEALLQRALSYVGEVRLILRPPAPEVRVDRERAHPVDDRLLLQIGEHVLEFSAPEHLSEKRTLDIKGGDPHTLRITLQPNLQLKAAGPADQGSVFESPWLWTGVGVAAVGAAVVLALVLQPEPKTRVGEPAVTAQTPPGSVLRF